MPKIIDLIHEAQERGTGPFIAFEYFPPRTDAGVANLYARLDRMAEAQPLYMDFTWGAGGSTSDLTLELSVEAKKRCKVETNMHLTCTNMPEEKLTTALDGAKAAGVHNIVALRGGACALVSSACPNALTSRPIRAELQIPPWARRCGRRWRAALRAHWTWSSTFARTTATRSASALPVRPANGCAPTAGAPRLTACAALQGTRRATPTRSSRCQRARS